MTATIEFDRDLYRYKYVISSLNTSEQATWIFEVMGTSAVDSIFSPPGWRGDAYGVRSIVSWGANDSAQRIEPGTSLTGLGFVANGLPSIQTFYAEGWVPIPFLEPEPDSLENDDILADLKSGRTLGPKDPPTPFNALGFLDTIKSYTNESRTLGWITSDQTKNKYARLIDSAKSNLTATPSRRGIVKAKLDSILINVYPDSSGGLITSEAYALLRFNTEYVLKNLRARRK